MSSAQKKMHGFFTIKPHVTPHFGVGKSRDALAIEDDSGSVFLLVDCHLSPTLLSRGL